MIKIGVIGAGHLGKIHIKCIKQVDSLELVGFYDTDKNNAKDVEKQFDVKCFPSIESLINECDAVDIVTPTVVHFELASQALRKSKHVFIEKPIVATPEEAKQLRKIAADANVKVQVGHVERFNPAMIAASPYISDPKFIESHRLSMFQQRGADVPVVLDLMIHDIDIVLHLINAKIKNISASGVAVISPTPDIASARIEFENGCVANLTASRISINPMRKTRIFQQNSYISIDFLNKKTEIISLSEATSSEILQSGLPIDIDGNRRYLTFKRPITIDTNAIVEELQSFATSILNNNKPVVTLDDGNYALEVAYKILEEIEKVNNIK